MALNPPINPQGVPFRFPNEYILLERQGILMEIDNKTNWKKEKQGTIYITSSRMIFVNKDFQQNPFKSLDIPFGFIFNVDFK